MPAGDRNAKGKPKDIVRHFSNGANPVCNTKGYGYVTNDVSDITCIKCKRKILAGNLWYPGK